MMVCRFCSSLVYLVGVESEIRFYVAFFWCSIFELLKGTSLLDLRRDLESFIALTFLFDFNWFLFTAFLRKKEISFYLLVE